MAKIVREISQPPNVAVRGRVWRAEVVCTVFTLLQSDLHSQVLVYYGLASFVVQR